MERLGQLAIEIVGRADKFLAELRKAERAAKEFQGRITAQQKNLQGAFRSLAGIPEGFQTVIKTLQETLSRIGAMEKGLKSLGVEGTKAAEGIKTQFEGTAKVMEGLAQALGSVTQAMKQSSSSGTEGFRRLQDAGERLAQTLQRIQFTGQIRTNFNTAAAAAQALNKEIDGLIATAAKVAGVKLPNSLQQQQQAFAEVSARVNQLAGDLDRVGREQKEYLAQQLQGIDVTRQLANAEARRNTILKEGAALQGKLRQLVGAARGQEVKGLREEFGRLGNELRQFDRVSGIAAIKTRLLRRQMAVLEEIIERTGVATAADVKQLQALQIQMDKMRTGLFGAVSGMRGFLINLKQIIQFQLQWQLSLGLIFGTLRTLRASLVAYTEFEQALVSIQAIARVTDEALAQLSKTALSIGENTSVSAKEAADGMILLAQAGFNAVEVQQAIGSATRLVIGTVTDMDSAVRILTTTLRAFNLDATQSSRVEQVLAAAVNKSKTSVEELNIAFNFAASAAAGAGLSIETTAAIIGTLADNGIRASTSGTALRQVVAALTAPTEKVSKVFRSLGLSMNHLNPASRDIIDIFRDIRDAGAGVTEIFGAFERRTASAVLQLIRNVDALEKMRDGVTGTLDSYEAFNKAQESVENRAKNLTNRLTNLAIVINRDLRPVFVLLIETASFLTASLTKLSAEVTGIALGFAGWFVISRAVSFFFTRLTGSAAAAGSAIAILRSGIVGLGFALAGLVGFSVLRLFKGVEEAVNEVTEKMQRYTEVSDKAADSMEELGKQFLSIQERLQKLQEGGGTPLQLTATMSNLNSVVSRLTRQFPGFLTVLDSGAISMDNLRETAERFASIELGSKVAELRADLEVQLQELENQTKRLSTIFLAPIDSGRLTALGIAAFRQRGVQKSIEALDEFKKAHDELRENVRQNPFIKALDDSLEKSKFLAEQGKFQEAINSANVGLVGETKVLDALDKMLEKVKKEFGETSIKYQAAKQVADEYVRIMEELVRVQDRANTSMVQAAKVTEELRKSQEDLNTLLGKNLQARLELEGQIEEAAVVSLSAEKERLDKEISLLDTSSKHREALVLQRITLEKKLEGLLERIRIRRKQSVSQIEREVSSILAENFAKRLELRDEFRAAEQVRLDAEIKNIKDAAAEKHQNERITDAEIERAKTKSREKVRKAEQKEQELRIFELREHQRKVRDLIQTQLSKLESMRTERREDTSDRLRGLELSVDLARNEKDRFEAAQRVVQAKKEEIVKTDKLIEGQREIIDDQGLLLSDLKDVVEETKKWATELGLPKRDIKAIDTILRQVNKDINRNREALRENTTEARRVKDEVADIQREAEELRKSMVATVDLAPAIGQAFGDTVQDIMRFNERLKSQIKTQVEEIRRAREEAARERTKATENELEELQASLRRGVISFEQFLSRKLQLQKENEKEFQKLRNDAAKKEKEALDKLKKEHKGAGDFFTDFFGRVKENMVDELVGGIEEAFTKMLQKKVGLEGEIDFNLNKDPNGMVGIFSKAFGQIGSNFGGLTSLLGFGTQTVGPGTALSAGEAALMFPGGQVPASFATGGGFGSFLQGFGGGGLANFLGFGGGGAGGASFGSLVGLPFLSGSVGSSFLGRSPSAALAGGLSKVIGTGIGVGLGNFADLGFSGSDVIGGGGFVGGLASFGAGTAGSFLGGKAGGALGMGDSTEAQIGAAVASSVFSIIGMIFGGPLGAFIGAFLGDLFGSFIGGLIAHKPTGGTKLAKGFKSFLFDEGGDPLKDFLFSDPGFSSKRRFFPESKAAARAAGNLPIARGRQLFQKEHFPEEAQKFFPQLAAFGAILSSSTVDKDIVDQFTLFMNLILQNLEDKGGDITDKVKEFTELMGGRLKELGITIEGAVDLINENFQALVVPDKEGNPAVANINDYIEVLQGVIDAFGDLPKGIDTLTIAKELAEKHKDIWDKIASGSLDLKTAIADALIDPEEIAARVADFQQSMKLVAGSVNDIFTADSFQAGFDSFKDRMKQGVRDAMVNGIVGALLEENAITGAFNKVFQTLREGIDAALKDADTPGILTPDEVKAIGAAVKADLDIALDQFESVRGVLEAIFNAAQLISLGEDPLSAVRQTFLQLQFEVTDFVLNLQQRIDDLLLSEDSASKFGLVLVQTLDLIAAAEDDSATKLMLVNRAISLTVSHLQAQIADIQRAATNQISPLQDELKALQREIRDEQREIAKERKAAQRAFRDQNDTLREQLKLLQDWVGVLSDVNNVLLQLGTTNLGTANPVEQFLNLMAELREQKAIFRDAGVSEADRAAAARRISQLVPQVLAAAETAGAQLPGGNFESLVSTLRSLLEEIQAEAQPKADRVLEIQEEIEVLTRENRDFLKSLDERQDALEPKQDRMLEIQDSIASIQQEASDRILDLNKQAAHQLEFLRDEAVPLLKAKLEEQRKALKDLLGEGVDADAILNDQTFHMMTTLFEIKKLLGGGPVNVADLPGRRFRKDSGVFSRVRANIEQAIEQGGTSSDFSQRTDALLTLLGQMGTQQSISDIRNTLLPQLSQGDKDLLEGFLLAFPGLRDVADLRKVLVQVLMKIATPSDRQFLLGFQEGGQVPGPLGVARSATVHGGEFIVTSRDFNALIQGLRDAVNGMASIEDLVSAIGNEIAVRPANNTLNMLIRGLRGVIGGIASVEDLVSAIGGELTARPDSNTSIPTTDDLDALIGGLRGVIGGIASVEDLISAVGSELAARGPIVGTPSVTLAPTINVSARTAADAREIASVTLEEIKKFMIFGEGKRIIRNVGKSGGVL